MSRDGIPLWDCSDVVKIRWRITTEKRDVEAVEFWHAVLLETHLVPALTWRPAKVAEDECPTGRETHLDKQARNAALGV